MSHEVNFDGIVGPTHNYSGLSYGNVASMDNRSIPSNPQEAALQGLEKMYAMMKMGMRQALLPPHERPFLPVLHGLGFRGSDSRIAAKVPLDLLIAVSSAAAIDANAATISPSADSADGRLHLTPG